MSSSQASPRSSSRKNGPRPRPSPRTQALPPSLEIHPEPDAAGAYEEMDVAALKASLARGTCEEEGRLFYVACTRARDTLTLSRAHYYRDNVRPKTPKGR